MLQRFLILTTAAIVSTACGGGSDAAADRVAEIARLATQADAAEALARSVARDTPCVSAAQCSVLSFTQTLRGCDGPKSVLVYSTAAETAKAASEAAARQNTLAAQAVDLQPVGVVSCPAAAAVPAAQCTANRCVAAGS